MADLHKITIHSQQHTKAPGRLLVWLFLSLFIFSCRPIELADSVMARQGTIDLSALDFNSGASVDLSGEWAFYWHQLLSPADFRSMASPLPDGYLFMPQHWVTGNVGGRELDPHGFATYRLRVETGHSPPPLSLLIRGVCGAYQLWVNGHLVRRSGVTGTGPGEGTDGPALPAIVPLPVMPPQTTSFDIILQVSNYSHFSGGTYAPLKLGTGAALQQQEDRRRWFQVLSLGIYLLMGCYHIALFLFRPRDLSPLYFSAYSLLWMVHFMTRNTHYWMAYNIFPVIDPLTLFHIELTSYFFTVPSMLLFLKVLFPVEASRAITIAYLSMALLLSAIFVAIPDSGIKLKIIQTAHLVSLSAIIVSVSILVRASIKKRPSARLLLAGGLILAGCGLNDILVDLEVLQFVYLMHIGLLVFIFSQACALALRFSKALTVSEALSAQLKEQNVVLSSVDRLKDEFIANTSHELRTPLSGIIGIAESMLAGAAGNLSETARRNLAMVVAGGRRLTALVNDLLDFSRLKNRDIVLNLQPVDLRTLVGVVLTVLKPLADAKNIAVGHTLSETLPAVMADEDRLQQILYNLVGNAVKFTEQGRVEISAAVLNGSIEVAVRDSGIGIPEDKLEDIFLSFEQVDGATNRKYGGTGLGLAITRKLVELHGGRIRADVADGPGATFYFTLPVAAKEARPSDALLSRMVFDNDHDGAPAMPLPSTFLPSDKDVQTGTPTILVVDDDPINLQVAANHLQVAGYGIRTAASGQEALRLIKALSLAEAVRPASADAPIDLVLLDIMMPGMTGYDVCRWLRERHTPSELPVIMLTARNRVADLVQGFEIGANDYLTKPYTRGELLSRVKVQLQLRDAYRTMAENARLKKELARRRETTRDLLHTQRRLTELLDSVDDAMFAVNEHQEVSFSNRPCQALLSCGPQDLIGRPVGSFFSSETGNRVQQEINNLARAQGGGRSGHQCSHQGSHQSSHQSSQLIEDVGISLGAATVQVHLLIMPMAVEDEQFTLFLLRRPERAADDPEDSSPHFSAVSLIAELNRNQDRLRTLEATLHALAPHAKGPTPAVQQELQTIDSALEIVGRSLITADQPEDARQLITVVMNLSITCWEAATGKEKYDLARESGLWKVYTNQDGWQRTQTLDKYLDKATLPKRPRWKLVAATAEYVLAACSAATPGRSHLEESLIRLRLVGQ